MTAAELLIEASHQIDCGCGDPHCSRAPMAAAMRARAAELLLPLSEDPQAITLLGDAIRVAEGRGPWSTDNLPGRDVARARAMFAKLQLDFEMRRRR